MIQLARSFGYKVIEEKVSAEFAMDADEAFCCGTAAVISPIGSIMHDDKKKVYSNGDIGPITQKLYDSISGIHSEKVEDSFGWLHEVNLNLNLEK